MRFFRLLAIAVILLACVLLGTACAGAKGAQGPQGDTGAQGPQGPPGIGVEWVGQWDSGTLYAKYDAVGYQGSSYISKQNSNTSHLPTDTNWWDLWVEKGDTGEQGIQGIQGVQGIPGFSTVVAMGNWDVNNYLRAGYNVVSVSHPETGKYIVTLNGIDFDWAHYVAIVNTPSFCGGWGSPSLDVDGALNIWVRQANSTAIDSYFQFVVFEIPD